MGKRRASGDGSFHQRADGLWCGRVQIEKRRYTYYGRTRASVKAQVDEAVRRHERGEAVRSSSESLGDYLIRWLEDVVRPHNRHRTYVAYRTDVRHLLGRLGTVPLRKLKPTDIQHMETALLDSHYAGSTVRHIHATLRRALGQAVQWGDLTRNPADLVKPPTAVRPEMATLSQADGDRVLEASAGTRWHALWLLLVSTGIRIGEALALEWLDITEDRSRLAVTKTLTQQLGGGLFVGPPKTGRSRRVVHLSPEMQRAFRSHSAIQAQERLEATEWEDNRLIFPNRAGRYQHQSGVSNAWRQALKALDIPHIPLHNLRHTAATWLLEEGAHPKLVQEMLGHATYAQTMDTYSHVAPAMHAEAAALMNTILTKRKGVR